MRRLSDQEIIESVLKGNTNDFSSLISRYKNRAFSLLLRLLKNRMEAEEALQDAFMKAFSNLQSFRKESAFGTWFYRIAYNTALTRLKSRKNKTDKLLESIDDFEAEGILKYEGENNSVNDILLKLIEKLPGNYSLVLTLFYINGFSCEEIAGLTSNSESNVKVLLYRARTALRKKITELKLEKKLI